MLNGPRLEMEKDWRFCRVLGGGTLALRQAGTEFTPMTARERKENALYTERLQSSTLHDVYGETIHRIASLPFEKPPTISGDLPPQLEAMVLNADRSGTSLSVFGSLVYQDAIDRGVGLFLVDNVPTTIAEPQFDGAGQPVMDPNGRPLVTTRAMTLLEVEQLDARPYLSRIDPDNLVGWQTETRNGREVCVELRVREWAYVRDENWADILVERIRLYTSTTVELWEKVVGKAGEVGDRATTESRSDLSGFRLIEQPRPTGFPENEIPIVAIYTRKVGFLHAKPPFLQLAHLNIKHWNQQSILDASIRFCLSPVLFLTGLTPEEAEQRPQVGEGATFATSSDTAAAQYVEITGSSLSIAQAEIDKTEARMRSRASEPLQQGSATATGEVRAEMRDQSEAQRWVEAAEWALYNAFVIAAKWVGATLPDDFNITLHRASSVLQVANPQRTANLQADAREGRITNLTYLKERARSGDFADEFDPEAEAEAVQQEAEQKVQRQMEALASQIQSERDQPSDPNADPDADPEEDDPNADPEKDAKKGAVPPQFQKA